MRIGLTGAQGTGKTTLARALAEKLGLPLIEEQARRAAEFLGIRKLSDLKNDPAKGQYFQQLCLSYQLEAEREYPGGFVSDRTVLDNMVYWMKWHQQGAESEDNLRYYKTVENHIKNGAYDLVVYVPPEIPLEDDGFRSADREYQKEIDFWIQRLMKALPVREWIRVTGPVEDRVAQVVEVVDFLGVTR